MRIGWRIVGGLAAGLAIVSACGIPDDEASVDASGSRGVSRPAGYVATSLAVPPFQPGSRPMLLGTADRLFVFGGERRLNGARFENGEWTDLPPLDLVSAGVLESASNDLVAVGLRCADAECSDGEISIARLRASDGSWRVEGTGLRRPAEFFSVKRVGVTAAGSVFFVGPELWIVDPSSGYEKQPDPHFPWQICIVDGVVTAAEPRAGGSVTEDDVSVPTFEFMVFKRLVGDSWEPLTGPPAGLSGFAAPVCAADGMAVIGGQLTASWRGGTWRLSHTAPPSHVSSHRAKPAYGGVIALGDDGGVHRFDPEQGWHRVTTLALREPDLAVLSQFGERIVVLDPGSPQQNAPRILEVTP